MNNLNIRFKSSHCINQNLRINKHQATFGIYPNPTSDILNINIEENAVIELFDINGRQIMNQNFEAGHHHIDVSKLSKGLYFVKLKYPYEVITERVIIY